MVASAVLKKRELVSIILEIAVFSLKLLLQVAPYFPPPPPTEYAFRVSVHAASQATAAGLASPDARPSATTRLTGCRWRQS
jgi:hypothetical protein